MTDLDMILKLQAERDEWKRKYKALLSEDIDNQIELRLKAEAERDRYKADAERLAEALVWMIELASEYVTDYEDKWGAYRKDTQLVYRERVDRACAALAAHERGEG